MPTLVLTTTSNPGTASWQDSTTLPVSGGGPVLLDTVSLSVPALVAGDANANGVAVPSLNFGDPFLISWNYTSAGPLPVYLKVSANINAPGNLSIVQEAPVLQGTPPCTILVRIYGF